MKLQRRNPSISSTKPKSFTYYRGSERLPNSPSHTNIETQKRHMASSGLHGVKKRLPKIKASTLPTVLAIVAVLGALLTNTIISPGNISYKFQGWSEVFSPKEEYQSAIKAIFKKNISAHFKLTLQSRELESQIKKQFPEVSLASVSLPLMGNQPVVGLSFNSPALIVKNTTGKYLVGNDGRVLRMVGTTEANLPIVEDRSGVELKSGERVLNSDDTSFLVFVNQEVIANNLTVENIIIGDSPRDIRLQITGDDYFIKLNFTYDERQQLGALWSYRDKVGQDASYTPSEYLDVRIAERVFVK